LRPPIAKITSFATQALVYLNKPENLLSIDLHTHTTASDGSLKPAELLERAASKGITTLAITDHDTLNGYFEARQALNEVGASNKLQLISGVELSTHWAGNAVHLVGL